MTDSEKKRQLRKHKTIATGLFLLMAIVYFSMVYFRHQNEESWMGYVEAFAEAGMVGALADWFAVTALFKYPLGLRIPHTNLIERKKDSIGDSLGSFVKDNFLTPQTIRPYIEKLDVVSFAKNWLIKPTNQELLEEELIKFIEKVIRDLDDEEVVDFMSKKGHEILNEFDLQDLVSTTLDYLVDKQKHTEIINALIPKAKEYINDSDVFIKDKINEKHPIISMFAGKRISKGVVDGVVSFLDDIEQNQEHPIRQNLEKLIKETALEIKSSDEWKSKLENLRDEFLSEERVNEYAQDLWFSVKESATKSFGAENSTLRKYVRNNIKNLADSLQNNAELQNKINSWIRLFIYRMILRNVNEVENLIRNTVEKWSGRELSDKLELEVGKDLQYIRVNGTLVGGLVGLIIYTITQLIF